MDIHPVLVDVGAAEGPPEIWDSIAKHSIYIGFDPDLRGIRQTPEGYFHKEVIFSKAVTSLEGAQNVPFYFTTAPYCSSILKPDSESLKNFLFSHLFTIEKKGPVQATSLNSVIDHLSLPCIDWLKTDSQGTDLRIFKSLKDKSRSRVLALDIEPGLINAYEGEDLFVDAHGALIKEGFWLSNLGVRGTVRMRPSTLAQVAKEDNSISNDRMMMATRETPSWVGARYLRTIEALGQSESHKREYVLLWVIALLDKQYGFALDLALEYDKVFGEDEMSTLMRREPISRIKRFTPSFLYKRAKKILPAGVRRRLRGLIQ